MLLAYLSQRPAALAVRGQEAPPITLLLEPLALQIQQALMQRRHQSAADGGHPLIAEDRKFSSLASWEEACVDLTMASLTAISLRIPQGEQLPLHIRPLVIVTPRSDLMGSLS